MRIAVVGGTGLVGAQVVQALRRAGHETVVIARSTGVDVVTGAGLAESLAGADAVIDALNMPAADPAEARELFGAAMRQLLAAAAEARVAHLVLLSILGLDRVEGNAHYAGKRVQEELVVAGPVPATILRAAQFHEFAAMVVAWTRRGDVATVPPLLVQPVASADVAEVLVRLATGEPRGVVELAGPEPQDLVDMARRTLAARGESTRLVPTWGGAFRDELAGNVLLPGPDAELATTTVDDWLATKRPDI